MTEREAVSAAAGALLALWHALLALSLAGISQVSLLAHLSSCSQELCYAWWFPRQIGSSSTLSLLFVPTVVELA